MAFLTRNKAKFCNNLMITWAFEKNAIFCRKLAKIGENCDHNIRHQVFVPIGKIRALLKLAPRYGIHPHGEFKNVHLVQYKLHMYSKQENF
jgi:hypothetical protein